MKQFATFLILVLVSTNASKYRPDYQFQQDLIPRNKYKEILAIAFDNDPFLPKLMRGDELVRWESPPDPKMLLLNDLDSLENFSQDDANDKIKRTKTSLSIDNPLDVLRQQYYRALARRKMYKDVQMIEKNRDYLLKTGKRSKKDSRYQINLNKQAEFAPASEKDFQDNGLEENLIISNKPNPTTRRYQTRMDDISYQT